MITWVDNKQIDKAKWDFCIQQSYNESIFVYSWYLDAVCDDWCAFILNDYEAVFPLAKKIKYNIPYIYQPFYVRYFGLYTAASPSAELAAKFLELICLKFKNLNVSLHESTVYTPNLISGISATNRQFQYLDISPGYDEVYKNYSKNCRRNIDRAAKQNYRILNQIAPQEIVELFKTTKGEELGVFKSQHYQRLLFLMNSCLKNSCGQTLALYHDDSLIASAFFMKSKDRLTYLNGSVTEEGRKNGAMHFLMDHFIRANAGKHQVLDFGGSSVESVARFYRNFGASDCVYLQLEKGLFFKLRKWIKLIKL